MATVTAPAPKSKPARQPAGTCSLTLTINGTRYRVRPIDGREFGALRAFRLVKLGGKPAPDGGPCVYDVAEDLTGAACDCPDFIIRRDGLCAAGCKHLRAMRAVGLLSPLAAKGGAR
jgi:hypothetical protein